MPCVAVVENMAYLAPPGDDQISAFAAKCVVELCYGIMWGVQARAMRSGVYGGAIYSLSLTNSL